MIMAYFFLYYVYTVRQWETWLHVRQRLAEEQRSTRLWIFQHDLYNKDLTSVNETNAAFILQSLTKLLEQN